MTPSRPWSLLVPVLALALAWSSSQAPAADLEATRVTLANGLRVILAPDSLAGTVDATLWYRSGTRHETTAQSGLALLAARITFRNGASDPLHALEVEGGSGQLAVTPDFTSLTTTVPAEALATALDFLAARLPGHPVSAPELAAERAAIRAERARPERTAVARALARLWGAAWPGHPYARTGAPPAAGADALKPADIEAWKKARFTPANAVLTLTGSFDRERALADIRSRFEAKPKGGAPSAAAAPAPKAGTRSNERIDSPARLCLVGWRGPGAGDPDAPALELLATCLGGGSQSRLTSALVRDWGLALTAQAGYSVQREGSLLWTLALVPPGADSAAVERTLLEAAKSVTLRAPEAFEVERARRQLEAAVWFGLQSSRQRGQALGEA
ncbi:MAG TPA: insulinase family protein, partial [Planctomycetota bacterium]|nr:insulinase family protein [Planctomycetota bacterium]